ncbi:MAG: histidine kinase [Archangiaceae bacterium]|nr:histidine kinase [Archangiaceae bacterium]
MLLLAPTPSRPARPAAPFLSTRALGVLALVPPVLSLLTTPLESAEVSAAHSARCLLATWLTTLLLGGSLHLWVRFAAPRLLARLPRRAALALVVAVGQAAVVLGLAALAPLLVRAGHRIDAHLSLFVFFGAVVLTAAYLIGARLDSALAERHQLQVDLTAASEEHALRSRLAALQAQMNPHFLFNSLNVVAGLIQPEPRLAEATLERLSGVLQYAISAGKRASVTLGEELEAVRDYLDVEQARFGDRLRSRIEVDADLHALAMPPLLLQPLVENAVLHGLSSREAGGEVCVRARRDGATVVLTVADDGVGPGGSRRQGNRVGLSSVRERVALTWGSRGDFQVRERQGGGFECELRVPAGAA